MRTAENGMKDVSSGLQQGLVAPLKTGGAVDKALNDFYKSTSAGKGESNDLRTGTAQAFENKLNKLVQTLTGIDPLLERRVRAVDAGVKEARAQGTAVDVDAVRAFIVHLDKNTALQENIAKQAREQKISEDQVIKNIIAGGPESVKNAIKEANEKNNQRIREEKERAARPDRENQIERFKRENQQDSVKEFNADNLNVTNFKFFDQFKVKKYETGTLGVEGKLIEDFGSGTLAMLHGQEGVVTKKQMESLLGQASKMGSSMSGMGVPQMDKMILYKNLEKLTSSVTSSLPAPETISSPIAATTGLNDVVTSLDKLNSKMDRLLDAHLEIGSSQIRAIRSNNNNLYERA